MRCADLSIAGVAYRLPGTLPVADAIAAGAYDAAEQEANAYLSVTVADGEAPPDMAVAAGRLALRRSGVPAADVALLLHASARFQGIDYWPAASYVHREVLGDAVRRAPALDVQQMCDGALGALELAASYLAADPARRAALITTGDRMDGPGFDRWSADVRGIVYGDGGAAAVLVRDGGAPGGADGHGFARLLAVTTVVDTGLEGMYRGDLEFADAPGRPVDVRSRREAFATAIGGLPAQRIAAGLTEAVTATLDEAGLDLDDVTRFVFPNVGLQGLTNAYVRPLGITLERTAWEWGRRTGHVGAADQLTGLTHLVESGAVRPGDRVMLVGIGAGFAWTCALLELTETRGWPDVAEGGRTGG
ncbi:MAG: 3-oxoacyl-ACP synthase [Streptosporangiales bacterium]|nr:3-oxoacyl-ACP synthase [Streptosporangiales bacterium]